MIFTFDDWCISVDVEKTKMYSDQKMEDRCQCGYCRNFCEAVDDVYPLLRPFLYQLGVHIEAPNELMPFEPTLFEATYCVCGSILQHGTVPIVLDDCTLNVLECSELDFETHCPQPCIAFVTSIIELPWVIEEDMNEVISPANDPEYLQRIWNRFLDLAPNDTLLS